MSQPQLELSHPSSQPDHCAMASFPTDEMGLEALKPSPKAKSTAKDIYTYICIYV
jgi:hypothetical protein